MGGAHELTGLHTDVRCINFSEGEALTIHVHHLENQGYESIMGN